MFGHGFGVSLFLFVGRGWGMGMEDGACVYAGISSERIKSLCVFCGIG